MNRLLFLGATTAVAFVFSAAPVAISDHVDHGPSGFSTNSAYAVMIEPVRTLTADRGYSRTRT